MRYYYLPKYPLFYFSYSLFLKYLTFFWVISLALSVFIFPWVVSGLGWGGHGDDGGKHKFHGRVCGLNGIQNGYISTGFYNMLADG